MVTYTFPIIYTGGIEVFFGALVVMVIYWAIKWFLSLVTGG